MQITFEGGDAVNNPVLMMAKQFFQVITTFSSSNESNYYDMVAQVTYDLYDKDNNKMQLIDLDYHDSNRSLSSYGVIRVRDSKNNIHEINFTFTHDPGSNHDVQNIGRTTGANNVAISNNTLSLLYDCGSNSNNSYGAVPKVFTVNFNNPNLFIRNIVVKVVNSTRWKSHQSSRIEIYKSASADLSGKTKLADDSIAGEVNRTYSFGYGF